MGIVLFTISSLALFCLSIFLWIVLKKSVKELNIAQEQIASEKIRADAIELRYENKFSQLNRRVKRISAEQLPDALVTESGRALQEAVQTAMDTLVNKDRQSFLASVNDATEGAILDLNFSLVESTWACFQQFKELADDTPCLIPSNVRIYYTQGQRTVVCLEQEPQVRQTGFTESLAINNKRAAVRRTHNGKVYWYNLAYPYIYFFLTFDKGKYTRSQVYFANKKLTSLKDTLHIAPLPNVYQTKYKHTAPICLGEEYDVRKITAQENITKQCDRFLQTFWSNPFNSHLGDGGYKRVDSKICDLKTWQANSEEDPLFVLSLDWPRPKTVKGIIEGAMEGRSKHKLDGCTKAIREKLEKGTDKITKDIQAALNASRKPREVPTAITEHVLGKVLNHHAIKVLQSIEE